MTAKEFYTIVKEYAKKEMMEQAVKAANSEGVDVRIHQAASNEAAKFYQMVENIWLDNADLTI